MRPIVVLGGYGRLGRACVLELAAQTNAPLRIAGRNAQRAESLALSLGERAAPCYADAADPRVAGARARGRGGGRRLLRRRPARRPAERARAARAVHRALAAAARSAQRAPPGRARLARAGSGRAPRGGGARDPRDPGRVAGAPAARDRDAADRLDRRLHARPRPRAATSGPRPRPPRFRSARRLPERWRFADPIGARALAPAACADLAGFAESHCVGALEYLEPPSRGLARSVAKLVARGAGAGFAVAARATPVGDGAAVEVELSAPDPVAVAAALAAALAAAVLERRVPAGLSAPRDALGPAAALTALEKRGARIRIGP